MQNKQCCNEQGLTILQGCTSLQAERLQRHSKKQTRDTCLFVLIGTSAETNKAGEKDKQAFGKHETHHDFFFFRIRQGRGEGKTKAKVDFLARNVLQGTW